jgi:hypothetical protein
VIRGSQVSSSSWSVLAELLGAASARATVATRDRSAGRRSKRPPRRRGRCRRKAEAGAGHQAAADAPADQSYARRGCLCKRAFLDPAGRALLAAIGDARNWAIAIVGRESDPGRPGPALRRPSDRQPRCRADDRLRGIAIVPTAGGARVLAVGCDHPALPSRTIALGESDRPRRLARRPDRDDRDVAKAVARTQESDGGRQAA